MAFYHQNHHHHHHQNHHTTTQPCCCHTPQPQQPPQQPPQWSHTTSCCDPILIATLVSQQLQTENPHKPKPKPKPNSIFPFQTYPFEDSPNNSSPFVSSLLKRIDKLESGFSNLSFCSSSSTTSYLRDAAARVIQRRFRVFLVRRSRTLRELRNVASVKSSLLFIKSLFSKHGFVDFDGVSRKAMDLLLELDSIEGEDKMIRESKKSITREIVQFLELIDGVCVERHQVMTRKIRSLRLVRNDKAKSRTGHDGRGYSEGSKGRNVDNEEKKLIASLKERVERIGKMSRALKAEESADDETEGSEHLGDEDGIDFNHIRSKHGPSNGARIDKSSPHSDGKKRVCFVGDGNGNAIKVYNVDGHKMTAARDVEEIEDMTKGRQDEEEAQSDEEASTQSSEADGNHNHDKEFTFPAPEPQRMEPRAEFATRKSGVKIAG